MLCILFFYFKIISSIEVLYSGGRYKVSGLIVLRVVGFVYVLNCSESAFLALVM